MNVKNAPGGVEHIKSSSIETIRRINQVARDHYHNDHVDFDHAAYLRECYAVLIDFLCEELSDVPSTDQNLQTAYLFSALSYKNEESEKIDFVSHDDKAYNFVNEELENLFKPTIDKLLEDINVQRSISLTQTLLKDKRKGKDLFLYTGPAYAYPVTPRRRDELAKIDFFSLSKLTLDPNKEFEHFYSSNDRFISEFAVIIGASAKEPEVRKIGTLLWRYRQIQEIYQASVPGAEFLVHFIRPSFIESTYNVLLSLGTNRRLTVDQLSLIYLLVYRIISQTVIERTKEAEQFKRRASFSLTTHALKTELQTTIKPTIASAKQVVHNLALHSSELDLIITEIEEQYEDLFCMTAFVSLIDKAEDKKRFESAGLKEGLLSQAPVTIDIVEYCSAFNALNPHLDPIVLSTPQITPLQIRVYDSFFSTRVLRLFVNTVFENTTKFGRRDSGRINLRIMSSETQWVFENDTNDETVEVDQRSLRGNLKLFQLLLGNTNSGKLTVEGGQYKFTVTYEAIK